MSRTSSDQIVDGITKNGFDYDLQVWVLNYIIQDCGHPESMRKCCNARLYAGQDIRNTT